MSLKALSTQTMIMVTEPLLDAKRDRKVLLGMPLTASLVPVIERSLKNLVDTQRTGSAAVTELAKLSKEGAEVDALHDRKLRGVNGLLTNLAELADDPAESKRYLDLRDRLFPDGLRGIGRSYRDEAGEARLARKRIDPATRKALQKIPAGGTTLQAEVEAWLRAADRLGELEDRRGELDRQISAEGTGQADAARARNEWIKAMRALESNLDLEPKATDAIRERLLSALHEADAKAERRSPPAKVPGSEPVAPPAPKPA